MGLYVIKPKKDVDFYVVINTFNDMPLRFGNREEIKEYLYIIDPLKEPSVSGIENSMRRADETSSSARRHNWGENFTLNYGGYGFIFRDDLPDIYEKFEEFDSLECPAILDNFVHPHED